MNSQTRIVKAVGIFWTLALGLGMTLVLLWALLPGPAEARLEAGPEMLQEAELEDSLQASIDDPLPAEPHIRLQKNDDYYDAAGVAITQVTSLWISEEEAWSRYQLGEFDSIQPPEAELGAIKASPTYSPQLTVYAGQCTYYYGFSHDVAPFDDPQVRAAFASAIERPRLISDTMTGDEIAALTLSPPGTFGHVDGYATGTGRHYSPTLAANLLAASGYTGTPTITLMFNESDRHQAIAEEIRQMWIDVLGVTVTLESRPWSEYLDLLNNGSPEERPGVWRLGWCADYPDADNWHRGAMLSNNRLRYNNPLYEAVVNAAAAEPIPGVRLDLYQEAESLLVMTDTAIIPIYYYVNHNLSRPDLERSYRPYGGQQLEEWTISGTLRPLNIVWGAPNILDPALVNDTQSIDYVDQLFLGLTQIDENGEALPELATGWTVSPDGLVYTFTLRPDVIWTDGVTVTAGDIEYGVLRSLDPALEGGLSWVLYPIANAQDYKEGNITDPNLVGVHALNDSEIRFTLHSPAAFFPMVAGLWPARPQPQWAIDTFGDEWTDPANIVTNGPYHLVSWKQAPYLRIEKEVDGPPAEGGNLAIRIRYYNDGGEDAENTIITDTLVGMSYLVDMSGFPIVTGTVPGGEYVTFDLGTLPAQSQGEFELFVRVTDPQGAIITSTAQITTSTPFDEGNPEEKEVQWSGQVEANSTFISLGKGSWTGDPAPDTDMIFNLDICNGSPGGSTASSEAVLTDTLHPALELIDWWSDPPNYWTETARSSQQVVLTRPSVQGDWCGRVYLRAHVDPGGWSGMTISNTAVLYASNNLDPNHQSYWWGQVGEPRVNLSIQKSLFPWYGTQLVPGGQVDYDLSYSNEGNMPTPGPVRITDTLPVSSTFLDSVHHHSMGIDGIEPVLITPEIVVWEIGPLESGEGGSVVVTLGIDDGVLPNTVLSNTAEIDSLPGETRYDDNTSMSTAVVYDHGPNLETSKRHNWNGEGQLNYQLYVRNLGDQPVTQVIITDSYPISTTFNGEWGDNSGGAINFTDNYTNHQLIWEFGQLNGGDHISLWFNADLDAPGTRLRWYTNTIAVNTPPGDANPADNNYLDIAFSGGEVDQVDLEVYNNHIWGYAPNGPITITTPYTWTVLGGGNFDWYAPDYFLPGDTIIVAAGAGASPVSVTVPDPFDAWIDSDSNTAWGQVDHLDHEWVEVDLNDGPSQYVQTDAGGNFTAHFADVPRGKDGQARYYTQIDHAQVTFHRQLTSLDLLMQTNYGHDWVEGNYEPGHTVWITVTESDGLTVKGTAELTSGYVPWWGGNSGFSTNWQGWSTNQPDIQAGDWVFGLVDNGKSSEARQGLITGEVDADLDTISGTIHADWFTQTLNANCGVWEQDGPSWNFDVDPNGGTYFCDFSTAGWDVQPGHQIGVQYQEPDGDWVVNMFEAYELRIGVSYAEDWVNGDTEPGTLVDIVVADSGGAIKATAQITAGYSGGSHFNTSDGDFWVPGQPDIQSGDRVTATALSLGQVAAVNPVGSILGEVDSAADTVSGTINAPNFAQTLNAQCGLWDDWGSTYQDFLVDPNGGTYFCDFSSSWDLQPGDRVGVQYQEPDGDWVINILLEPWLEVQVNQSHNWVQGKTSPDSTIVATVWRDGLPALASSDYNGNGTDWSINFCCGDESELRVGDIVEVSTSGGLTALVEIIPMQGAADSVSNSLSGQIFGVSFPAPIQGEVWEDGGPNVAGMTDGAGFYSIDFNPFDLLPAHMTALWYLQPDGNMVGIVRHGLRLGVGVGRDQVRGHTIPDTLVTVTVNGGQTMTTTSDLEGEFFIQFDSDIATLDLIEAWAGAEYVNLIVEPMSAEIDGPADRVWGFGPPNSDLNVSVNGDWRWTSTDGSGFFEIYYDWDISSDLDLEVEYQHPEGHYVTHGFGPSDMQIHKNASVWNLVPGDTFSYQIYYSNNASGPASDVIITDTLPFSITYLGDSSGVSPTIDPVNRTLVWNLGGLSSHRGWDFELWVELDPAAPLNTNLNNQIEISDPNDRDPDNNQSESSIWTGDPQVDTWVNKSLEGGIPIAGEVITYQIYYGNNGNRSPNDILITDTLPPGVSFITSTYQGPFFPSPGQVVWDIGSLEPGRWEQFALVLQIDGGALPGDLLVNHLAIGGANPDNNPRDNQFRHTLVVEAPEADLWVSKTMAGDFSSIENDLTYYITFQNSGNVPAQDVVLTDTLPASMVHLWHSAGSAAAVSDGIISWQLGTVPPGGGGQIMVGVRVSETVEPGTVMTNVAQIQTSTPELDYNNNVAIDVLSSPQVICVPWEGVRAHRVWPGLETTLKGTAQGYGLTSYEWDPGDGSPPITGMVNDPYAIEARHSYLGAVGEIYTATLTVWGAFGWSDSDTYLVQIFDPSHGVEVDVAVDEGLWYLHKSAYRYETGGYAFADWQTGGSGVAETASAIQAFQVQGHRPGGNPLEDPYVENVQRGWNELLAHSVIDAMSVEPAGDPDSNGDGIGIGIYSDYNHSIYEAGLAMMALASTGTPNQVAQTGQPYYVRGRTYLELAQNMADWFAWGQNDEGSGDARGGWRYQPNSGDSDNSNTQFPVLGLAAAEDNWSVIVPNWVKDELRDYWLAFSQNSNGGFGYDHPNSMVNVAKTGAGIMNLAWTGVPLTDTRIISASLYIELHWNDPPDEDNYGGNVGDLYAMYAVKKGSQLADIYNYGPYLWHNEYTSYLVGVQGPDGRFDEDLTLGVWFGDWQPMATSWSIMILSPGLYRPLPVPVLPPILFGGIGPAFNNGRVEFDASLSHHTAPDRHIVFYEWDFGDGSAVISTTGPITTHIYLARDIYIAQLTVWDDAGTSATRAAQVNITAPDTPPVADPNGPYQGIVGEEVILDGTGSFDPDEWMGDAIVLYEWDIDGSDLITTTEPTLVYSWPAAGNYLVTLRVRDRGADFGLDSPKWSDPESSSVTILQVADLAITKVDEPDPVTVGQYLTYTLEASNYGPWDAVGVVLTDVLPAGVTLVSVNPGQPICTVTGGVVSCSLGDIPAGGSALVEIVVTPDQAGSLINLATVSSDDHDPNPADNVAVEGTLVIDAVIPYLFSITPDNGYNNQSTAVTIDGANFQNGATAALDGIPLQAITFVDPSRLLATVPAGLTPGSYDLTVTNPDGNSAILLDAFTVLVMVPPTVSDMNPSQGPNDRPITVDILGSNFANGVTATLEMDNTSVPLEGLLYIDSTHLRALVPISITQGVYTLTVTNPNGDAGSLPEAYQAVEGISFDDLYANRTDLWLDPPTVRAGDSPTLGLTLRRQGGQGDLFDVLVEFYEGDPGAGNLIGSGVVPVLPPDSEITTTVSWTPAAGSYDLYAVIDPAGDIPENDETNNVISHTVLVRPRPADTVPPTVVAFDINGGAANTSDLQVILNTTASDDPGGSGVAHLLFIEYQFVQSIGDWTPVAQSGWLPYNDSSDNYPWRLTPGPGVHYLQVWAADRAGNISVVPGCQMINYLPGVAHVAQGEVQIYRLDLEVGQTWRVLLSSLSGDADLYIWAPDGSLVAYSWADNPEDVTFPVTMDGVYQIEVEGWISAYYELEFIPVGGGPMEAATAALPRPTRGRDQPFAPPGSLPGRLVGLPTPPEVSNTIYLPIVVKQ